MSYLRKNRTDGTTILDRKPKLKLMPNHKVTPIQGKLFWPSRSLGQYKRGMTQKDALAAIHERDRKRQLK